MVTRLIIMSDSHGDRTIVEEIKKRYQGQVDAIFHNGDSELEANDDLWNGIYVVKGNCDWAAFPERTTLDIAGLRIAQTHGHLYGINYGWTRLDYLAEEVGADICLYGHLHVPAADMREGVLFINPGSISQPRGMIQERLYAQLDIYPDHYHIEFLDRNHQTYPALTRDLKR
ncbi:metallophosphoesterase [Streptococcus moroccensis]|uniref:Phosphoesterase n=1 Tax=Streptococcus moroccensis TaxID=1451356 RepID=A0ABT9YQH3_9STRE|nr:metallophosphoesterase [Streptococcus moroccensis]MDQ0222249.1 putative phosphoesterase [Streptococcus moroccensis]